jgi:N-acetylglucosaminyldiphosphoundecaprenol N-acetyl-beta-D-mannosaminyltransferase
MNTLTSSLPPLPTANVIGTECTMTSYAELAEYLRFASREESRQQPLTVDFTNTQIAAMRRDDPEFAAVTQIFDHFVPDSQVLTAAMGLLGGGRASRVYGPTFFRECVLRAPRPLTHYFLGGSEQCLKKLRANLLSENSDLDIVGSQHGYFGSEEEAAIVEEINRLSPDFVWVGLGTPLQQQWISRHASAIDRGVICAVGFAFDVNAGTKPDAPLWMQYAGLGWLFRLASEPQRLWKRYLHWNSRFLWLFSRQWLSKSKPLPLSSVAHPSGHA